MPHVLVILGLGGLLPANAVSAQSTEVGLKGGLNLSDFHGANIGTADTRQGHIFGAFVQLGLGGLVSFQQEAHYSRRGAHEAELFTEAWGPITDALWNYNYLDFVSLVKVHVNSQESPLSVSVFAGPVVSFLVGAKTTGTKSRAHVPPYVGSFPYVNPLNYNTRGNDVGGTVGADLSWALGSTRFVFDVRYTQMMLEFDEAPYDEQYSRKHRAFSFQVGLSLTPSAWRGSRPRRRVAAVAPRPPPENRIVLLERITRGDIAARREDASVYDIIRLERPQWVDTSTETVRGTLFLDGRPWVGSAEILKNRRGTDVEEIRRMQGAPGPYRGHGLVIEIVSRRGG